MAKRFTDSTKWSKPFIRSMKAPYKLLWLYILDECDHAGIWQVDFEVAQVKIGEKLNKEIALNQLGEKVIEFAAGEKWFIPDFIEFQYGVLNSDNRAHNSVIQLLNKYNLSLENKPLISPLQGAKDMVKDKDMVKVKDKEAVFEINYGLNFELKPLWLKWKNYKITQHREKYKTVESEQIGFNSLVTLSGGNYQTANKIIDKSISALWKGLFELDNKDQQPVKGKIETAIETYNKGIEILRKEKNGTIE
jgi:hypothetical protein